MKLYILTIAVFLLTIFNGGKVNAEEQKDNIQYRIDQLELIQEPEELLNARLEIIKLVENSDYTLFLELSNKNLALAKKENFGWAQIDILTELGESFITKGNYGIALNYLNQALKLAEVNEFKPYVGWVTLAIGNAYEGMFNFKRANEFFKLSLKVFTDTQTPEGIALASTNIGNTYLALYDFENSKKYLNIGLNERLKLNDPIQTGYVQMYIANRSIFMGEFGMAKENLLELINGLKNSIHEENLEVPVYQVKDLIGTALCLLSNCEDSLNLNDLKYERLFEAEQIFRELQDTLNLSTVFNLISGRYLIDDQLDKAVLYADSANLIATNAKVINQKAESARLLSDIYFRLDNFDLALKFHKEYKLINDSMYNESVTKAISNVDVFVGTITKEKDYQILKLNVEYQKKVKIIVFTGLGLLLSLLLFIIFYIANRYRKGKMANKVLLKKNHKIEEQRKKLILLNDELHKLVISKDKFHSIIAHDLRNPVGSVYSCIQILSDSYDELPDSDRKELIQLSEQTAKKTLNLLENLLAWSRVQGGHLKLNKACFEITKEVDEIINNLKHVATSKSIEVEVKHNGGIEIVADKEMIATVIRNLFSNAVKFTSEGKKIIVGVQKKEKMVEVWVEDQGIGIPSDKIDELFLIESEVQRPGTNNESGTGLGLQLSNEFVKLHDGYFDVKSEEFIGSRFAFSIPLKNKEN